MLFFAIDLTPSLQWKKFAEPSIGSFEKERHFIGEPVNGELMTFHRLTMFVKSTI